MTALGRTDLLTRSLVASMESARRVTHEGILVATGSKSDVPKSSPERRFLSLDGPILQNVAQGLLGQFRGKSAHSDLLCDMRSVVVVLPSSLAARRLGELLVIQAEAEQLILYPPQIVTIGGLPERLYCAKHPFASDLVQELAWVDALRSVDTEELKQIVPSPPPPAATQQWFELGKMLSSIHRETASERKNFEAIASLVPVAEQARWTALAAVQRAYLDRLDALSLWDVQTARLFALDNGEAAEYIQEHTSERVIVVGCVDLNATQRGFLSAIANNVEIWIGADESHEDAFDAFGSLNCTYWQDAELQLPPESLLVAGSPNDQAKLVSGCLAQFGDRYHVRDVTIGVPDVSLISTLKRELALNDVVGRHGPGTAVIQSEPAQLLSLIAQYINLGRYSDFAALVRHAAVDNLITNSKVAVPDNWLSQLDRYSQSALPKTIDGFVNEDADGAETFWQVSKLVNRWLTKLGSRKLSVSAWVQPLLAVFKTAYGNEQVDLHDPVQGPLYSAAIQVSEAIIALRDIPPELEPTLTLSELVDWLLRSMGGGLIPEPSSGQSIEMLGWLELALDDAPALVLTGVHDGVLPESVNADAFLPNGLRRQLGMMDNARRYARDAYSMQVLISTRQDLRVVVGRTDADGDPLVPSRLLTACPLGDLPSRVLHLVSEDVSDALPVPDGKWKPCVGASQLSIPRPTPARPLSKMSVTAFRDYLASPYRFYLKHVLRLRDEDDCTRQLDAAGFGVLVHETLDGLGCSEMAACGDEKQIEEFLIARLHELAVDKYGQNPPPAVLIQIEQAELRLSAFAPKQAQRALDGWEIRHVEATIGPEHNVVLGDEEHNIRLIGRIDRVDFHKYSGKWAIWDYKTSESPKNPVKVHYSPRDGWLDLQLPLYRHLGKKLGILEEPILGYISIPKQSVETGFYPASFSASQLADADQKSHAVAAAVIRGEFWTEDSPADVQYDDFSRICMTGIQQVESIAPARKLSRFTPPENAQLPDNVLQDARSLITHPVTAPLELMPEMIRASAGTGKTFQLSNRLLQIILSGQEVDGVLATTFTRKAAGEIMHRVLQRLAIACMQPDQLKQLQEFCGGDSITAAVCLAALRRVTASIHRLRISTLDSFFSQVARTFSLEMGLPPGWSTMDPVQEPHYQLEAISRMLDGHDRLALAELVRMLAKGESSRQVVEQVLQTVGSGYTVFRNTKRTAWDQLPLPEAPSEGAIESALLTLQANKMEHRSADSQLEKLHLLASVGDWEAVINHGIYDRINDDVPTYYRKEIPSDLVLALETLSDRAAAELLPLRRNQTVASRSVLEAYDSEYQSLTRSARQLAFSDVTYYLADWLVGHQERDSTSQTLSSLQLRLDCGVQHLLLDEFQDTAPEQWNILEPMAKPLGDLQAEGVNGSFFCVGDTKQAIYGWRGGVAEIFDSVSSSIDGIQQHSLQKSFRSSPQVIQTVNSVFESLSDHPNYSGCEDVARKWSHVFPEHSTSRDDLRGYACLRNTPKVSRELVGEEKKETVLSFAADEIAELASSSSASIGVLFRTNADVARMIALLRQRGVSASQDGGNPLDDSAAVELILSLIHLADHPGDRTCAFHIANSPLAKHLPVDPRKAPAELAVWIRRRVLRTGLAPTIGYFADMFASSLSWWDQHRVRQLIDRADAFSQNSTTRLRDFEDAVMRDRVALPTAAQVKVMTVHKSKGLEFDAVFLPDMTVAISSSNALFVLRGDNPQSPADGVLRYMNSALQAKLPGDWQQAFDDVKQRGVVESLCLLYVAMTRARRGLYMYARPTSSKPSAEFGSLLQSTLGDGKLTNSPQETVFETGDAKWFEDLPPVGNKAKIERESSDTPDAAPMAVAIELHTDIEAAPARALQITGPSAASRTKDKVALGGAFSLSRSVGSTYGNLIHGFFQQITWLDDYNFDPQQLRRLAQQTVEPEALRHISLDQVIEQFQQMLTISSVRRVLSQSRYQLLPGDHIEIDNERPVSLVTEHQLITGTIDRLTVVFRDGKPHSAEIFDYKTDAYDPTMSLIWKDDRLDYHRPQMQMYADVVSRLFSIPRERVASYLVMLKVDDLVRCDTEQTIKGPTAPAEVETMLPF